jgi:mevalonate kinase
MIAGRAHGKVILLGEHAVVHGHPALAAALDRGVTVEMVAGDGALRVPAWDATFRPGEPAPVARALAELLEETALPLEGVDLVARLQIPAGAGLGASAALGVAIARAVLARAGLPDDPGRVAAAAMAWETVIHGQPSGIDHAVAARGGVGLFTRAAGMCPVAVPAGLVLVIGDTGRARDTRGRVARVAELLAARPEEVCARFAAIAGAVECGRLALAAGDLPGLAAAMEDDHDELAALEVSTPEIERMRRLAREAGALGAKLTGGGGGGCVIAVAPGREPDVLAAWERAGFRGFTSRIGGRS